MDILDKIVQENAKVLAKAVTILLVYVILVVSLGGLGTSASKVNCRIQKYVMLLSDANGSRFVFIRNFQ